LDKTFSRSSRKFGLDLVGSIPWGTNICQLYETKQDLLEVLVPYFAAGLKANEFCRWAVSLPLTVPEAKRALKKAVPDLNNHQIEITTLEKMYCGGSDESKKALSDEWAKAASAASTHGFYGLRLAANLPADNNVLWKEFWKNFAVYEKSIANTLALHDIIVLCGYPYSQCSVKEILDIERYYSGTLIKRGGVWLLIEDAGKRKKSEERYRKIIQTSIDGFYIIDGAGRFLEVNDAYCKLIGYSRDELLNMHIFDVVMNKSRQEIADRIQHILAQGYERFETIHHTKPGQPLAIEISATAIGKNDDKQICIFAHNINRRKHNEEALQQSETKYRELANSITDSFVALNNQLVYLYWNKKCEKITGVPAEQAVGKYFFEVFKPNKGTRKVAKMYLEVLKTKKPLVFIDELSMNGKHVFVENHIYPSKIGICVFTKDITPRKELEKKLVEYTQRLEDIVKVRTEKLKAAERLAAIGETAGMVGHDIRNPLQAICGELYLAKVELDAMPDSEGKAAMSGSIDVVNEQLSYINKIVADLQDFAKTSQPYLEDVDLKKAICGIVSSAYIPDDVKVVVSVQEDFPKMQSDLSYLRRILINLITNAVQAMPQGGKLTLTATANDKTARIQVEDTGHGISEDVKEKIFKPLFTTKAKGQGLGLAVVKKLTFALGGSVAFDSVLGKGTCFTLEIPLKTEVNH
jgi:PAS domain S-box-containing protein